MGADRKKAPDTADLHEVRRSRGNGRCHREGGFGERAPGGPGGTTPSGRDSEIRQLVDAVRALPDVRLEKVAAIRKAIESGTYVVDSLKVAGKMIEEIPLTRGAEAGWRS